MREECTVSFAAATGYICVFVFHVWHVEHPKRKLAVFISFIARRDQRVEVTKTSEARGRKLDITRALAQGPTTSYSAYLKV